MEYPLSGSLLHTIDTRGKAIKPITTMINHQSIAYATCITYATSEGEDSMTTKSTDNLGLVA